MSMPTRWDYTGAGLPDEVPETPWELTRAWVAEADDAAARSEVHEPRSLAVATVDAAGAPDVRVVLMRFFDPRGPGFISSRASVKAAQLAARPVLAAALTWTPLFRAIRFRGEAVEIAAAEAEAYWRERPWGARISSRASRQSHPTGSRKELEAAFAREAARWPQAAGEVPVPRDWVGYRLRCREVEFWAGRPDRLHDRFRYERPATGDLDEAGAWRSQRLQP